MKYLLWLLIGFAGANTGSYQPAPQLPSFLKGAFEDDYGISYTISDSSWKQGADGNYELISCNVKEQYIIAKVSSNAGKPVFYARIDYMRFEKMEPYEWGYCYTAYEAKTEKEAVETAAADRANPRKGCNGFPFSRMKRKQR